MITSKLKLEDNVKDDIGMLLEELSLLGTWTNAKRQLTEQIQKRAIQEGYLKFSGGYRTYLLQQRGSYCLIDVPSDQKGALSVFRGKRIRLICIDYGNNVSTRIYLAKESVDQPTTFSVPIESDSRTDIACRRLLSGLKKPKLKDT